MNQQLCCWRLPRENKVHDACHCLMIGHCYICHIKCAAWTAMSTIEEHNKQRHTTAAACGS
jgi:hypothetical protein